MNNYIKSFKQFNLTEALKAEDYEAAVVIGWYKNNGKKFDLASSGISDSVYKTVMSNPSVLNTGKKIAKAIATKFSNKNAKAEQYGRARSSLTSFWTSYGATDTTPKTDILIGSERLSLKIGIAQLMSGGQSESNATFYAALKSVPNLSRTKQFKTARDIFESFVTSTLAPGKLRPIIKKGNNPVVNAAEKAHKDCMSELGALFEKSPDFKIAFAREAMSGYEKYGRNSKAAAEFMVVASKTGSSVSINSVDDDKYCMKIANKMKLQARFKTSGRVIQKKKTGEYNFWSVVSLIVDAMSASESESLTEGIFDVIKRKAKSIYSSVISKVISFVQAGVTRFMKFLGITPEIKVRRNITF